MGATALIEIVVALAAAATGFRAAWHWWKSSQVQIDLGYTGPGLPPNFWRLMPDQHGRDQETELPRFVEPPGGSTENLVMATWDAMKRGANLNARAAVWTAIAVALAALDAILGALPLR